MFGLGFGEMLLILAVALVVIGPKKLPGLARSLGRGLVELRRYTDDIQRTVQREIHAPFRDDEGLGNRAGAHGQRKPGPPPATAPLAADEPNGRPDGSCAPETSDPEA